MPDEPTPATEANTIDVVYVAPSNPGGSVAAGVVALLIAAGILWILAKVLHTLVFAGLAVGICVAVVVVGALARRPRLLRPRRVIADRAARTVTIEHRGGVVVVGFDDCQAIAQETPVMGDGVALDAVVITRRDGARVAFSVLDSAAAEGAVRALRAVIEPNLPPSSVTRDNSTP